MKNNQPWIPITELPPVNEDLFSEDIMVKSEDKTGIGWYDGYISKWYIGNDRQPTMTVKATHWKPLNKKV